MIPSRCPRSGCGSPVGEDTEFLRDASTYGINRTRLRCAIGHTTYVGEQPPSLTPTRMIRHRGKLIKAKATYLPRICVGCDDSFLPPNDQASKCRSCVKDSKRQSDVARRARLAAEGRNTSGWKKISGQVLINMRSMGTRRKRYKAPQVDASEEDIA